MNYLKKGLVLGGLANACLLTWHYTALVARVQEGGLWVALRNFTNEGLEVGDQVIYRDFLGRYHQGTVTALPGSFYEEYPLFWRSVSEGCVKLRAGDSELEVVGAQVLARRCLRLGQW
jgi:hypothetical protein